MVTGVSADYFLTSLLVVSEMGFNNLSGLLKVLCGWELMVTYSLQLSRNISAVSAVQFVWLWKLLQFFRWYFGILIMRTPFAS